VLTFIFIFNLVSSFIVNGDVHIALAIRLIQIRSNGFAKCLTEYSFSQV